MKKKIIVKIDLLKVVDETQTAFRMFVKERYRKNFTDVHVSLYIVADHIVDQEKKEGFCIEILFPGAQLLVDGNNEFLYEPVNQHTQIELRDKIQEIRKKKK